MDVEEKSFIEHYGDFRKSIILSLSYYVIFFVITLISLRWILPIIKRDTNLVVLGPMEVIQLYVTIAAMISLGLSIPFICLQMWMFVRSALTKKEKRVSFLYIPFILVSFFAGIAFGYFIIFPSIYSFLIHLGEQHFTTMITAKKYFSFLIMSTIPFGFFFQMPVTMVLLTNLGIANPMNLAKFRRYVYFIFVIISAIITPPDIVSQMIVLLPLIILFELGVLLSKIVYKKRYK